MGGICKKILLFNSVFEFFHCWFTNKQNVGFILQENLKFLMDAP